MTGGARWLQLLLSTTLLLLLGCGTAWGGVQVAGSSLVSPRGDTPATAVRADGAGIVAYYDTPTTPGARPGPGDHVLAALVSPAGVAGAPVEVGTLAFGAGIRLLDVGIGADGLGVVAWRDGDSLRVATIGPGGLRSTQTITDTIQTYGGPVRLAVDSRGDAAVAWVDRTRTAHVALRAVGAATFGPWIRVSPSLVDTGVGQPLDVALDPTSGRVTVVFARSEYLTHTAPYPATAEVTQAPFGGQFPRGTDLLTDSSLRQLLARTSATGGLLVGVTHSPSIGGGGERLSAGVTADGGLPQRLVDLGPSGPFFSAAVGPTGRGLISSGVMNLSAKVDTAAVSLFLPGGTAASEAAVIAPWAPDGNAINDPQPAFDPTGKPLIVFTRNQTQLNSERRIGALQLSARDAPDGRWCPPQTIADGVGAYLSPALDVADSGAGLLAWQDATAGIRVASVLPAAGCQPSAVGPGLGVAPVVSVSRTGATSFVGLSCRHRCRDRLELVDRRGRRLAAARVRLPSGSALVRRVALSAHARHLVSRASRVPAVASVRDARGRIVRSPVVLAR